MEVKTDELIVIVDELIDFSIKVNMTKLSSDYGFCYVSPELFTEFRAASLSFLQTTFGNNHPFFVEFNVRVKLSSTKDTEEGRGILKAAKQEIKRMVNITHSIS